MSAGFPRIFPVAALAFSLAALLVTTAPVVVAFSIPVDQMNSADRDLSPLSALVVDHFRAFALSAWAYCAAAAVAAVGLLRHRNWAYRIWIALLAVGLAWGIGITLSETLHLILGEPSAPDPLGYFPRDSVLSALVVVPTGLAMAALLVFLLRKLVAHREELLAR
jgi:hypothetical protein